MANIKIDGALYTPMERPPPNLVLENSKSDVKLSIENHFAPVPINSDNLAMSNVTRQFFTEGLQELLDFEKDIPLIDEEEDAIENYNFGPSDQMMTVDVQPNPVSQTEISPQLSEERSQENIQVTIDTIQSA